MEGVTLYTWEELDAADTRLGVSGNTADLPRACLGSGMGGHRRLRRATQNFALCMALIPRVCVYQPTYCQQKPGRPKQQIMSFRTLSLCQLQLRNAEALWSARHEERLWAHAGPHQLGRRDAMFSVILEVEAALIRKSLGLPEGGSFLMAPKHLTRCHQTVSR